MATKQSDERLKLQSSQLTFPLFDCSGLLVDDIDYEPYQGESESATPTLVQVAMGVDDVLNLLASEQSDGHDHVLLGEADQFAKFIIDSWKENHLFHDSQMNDIVKSHYDLMVQVVRPICKPHNGNGYVLAVLVGLASKITDHIDGEPFKELAAWYFIREEGKITTQLHINQNWLSAAVWQTDNTQNNHQFVQGATLDLSNEIEKHNDVDGRETPVLSSNQAKFALAKHINSLIESKNGVAVLDFLWQLSPHTNVYDLYNIKTFAPMCLKPMSSDEVGSTVSVDGVQWSLQRNQSCKKEACQTSFENLFARTGNLFKIVWNSDSPVNIYKNDNKMDVKFNLVLNSNDNADLLSALIEERFAHLSDEEKAMLEIKYGDNFWAHAITVHVQILIQERDNEWFLVLNENFSNDAAKTLFDMQSPSEKSNPPTLFNQIVQTIKAKTPFEKIMFGKDKQRSALENYIGVQDVQMMFAELFQMRHAEHQDLSLMEWIERLNGFLDDNKQHGCIKKKGTVGIRHYDVNGYPIAIIPFNQIPHKLLKNDAQPQYISNWNFIFIIDKQQALNVVFDSQDFVQENPALLKNLESQIKLGLVDIQTNKPNDFNNLSYKTVMFYQD